MVSFTQNRGFIFVYVNLYLSSLARNKIQYDNMKHFGKEVCYRCNGILKLALAIHE